LVGTLILALAAVIVLIKPLPFVVDATDYAIVTAFRPIENVVPSYRRGVDCRVYSVTS
jgi:hypothetical protein